MDLKILVFEDEPQAAMNIRNKLNRHGYKDIHVFSTYVSAISAISENNYDLAILDIHCDEDEHAGLKFAKLLNRNGEIPIIFMTGHEEFISKAIEINPDNILSKPFNHQTLINNIQLAINRLEEKQKLEAKNIEKEKPRKKKVFHKKNGVFYGIAHSDILYAKGEHGVTRIVTKHKDHITYASLGKLEEIIDDSSFVRIDRSHLINTDKIVSFANGEVSLEGGKEFALSKMAFSKIKEQLNIIISKPKSK